MTTPTPDPVTPTPVPVTPAAPAKATAGSSVAAILSAITAIITGPIAAETGLSVWVPVAFAVLALISLVIKDITAALHAHLLVAPTSFSAVLHDAEELKPDLPAVWADILAVVQAVEEKVTALDTKLTKRTTR